MEFLRSLSVSRISSCCGLVALSHVFISAFVLRHPLQSPVISSMVQMDMQGDTMPVFLPTGVSGVGIGEGLGGDIGRGDGGVVVGYRESQNGEDCKGNVSFNIALQRICRLYFREFLRVLCVCLPLLAWLLRLCLSVAFALVLFNGTRSRNRRALYDDGRKTSRA